MRTTDRIGFKLIIKEPDTSERTIVVCPRYDGLKLKWTKASGKVYHNKNIEGNVEFWGVDFVTLHNCALRTKFTLVIFYKGRGEVARCEFRKTDCEWDIDHGTCKVDVSVWDKYKKLEDGKDNEYNVVQMGLQKKKLGIFVYPQIQAYLQEDDNISLTGFKEIVQYSVTPNHDMARLTSGMHFSPFVVCGAIKFGNSYAGHVGNSKFSFRVTLYELVNGERLYYNGEEWRGILIVSDTGWTEEAYNRNIKYYVAIRNGFVCVGTLIHINANTEEFIPGVGVGGVTDDLWHINSGSLYSYKYNYNTLRDVDVTCRFWLMLGGLAACEGGNNNTELSIPDDDIMSEYSNNRRSIRYNNFIDAYSLIKNAMRVSTRVSSTDKGYGSVGDGTYYNTPDDTNKWMPLRQDSWFSGFSLWIKSIQMNDSDIEYYKVQKNINDFYSFGDVIKKVLEQIDDSIVFEPDVTHSRFLFDSINPISGQPQNVLYISQKSNILNFDYDYPAWQAPISFSKIVTLLKNAFGCYYHIDENNHLHIEHLSYYENGGSYIENKRSVLDLRTLINTSNRKSAAWNTGNWKWDIDGNGIYSSACRYEYGWMDTQSVIFDGETIDIPDEYRLFTNGKVEERKVDWFSSDIDFLTSVQAECSSDGFAIVMESITETGLIISGNENYVGQNYELSFEYLQPKYLIHDIYSSVVTIGGVEYSNINNNARMRVSTVTFCMPNNKFETNPVLHILHDTWVSPNEIIVTEAGDGIVDSLEIDIHSEKWTATVRYNNE